MLSNSSMADSPFSTSPSISCKASPIPIFGSGLVLQFPPGGDSVIPGLFSIQLRSVGLLAKLTSTLAMMQIDSYWPFQLLQIPLAAGVVLRSSSILATATGQISQP